MIGFGVLALYRWHQTQLIFFLLLVLRDFAAGYFFLKRKPAKDKATFFPSLLAYVSAAMPLLYFSSTEATNRALFLTSDFLAILGFLVVAFATLELGTSIGISPANRGLVSSGIYRYIKHPMYTGYIVSEIGLVLLNLANLWVFALSISLYLVRSQIESSILTEKHV